MTLPGVPMLFAGDELGLEGAWGEDARRTMPWERAGVVGRRLPRRSTRTLARLRRSCPRSRAAGSATCTSSADAVAFLRETRDERLLVLAARAPHAPIVTPFTNLETLYGDDAPDGVLPSDGPAVPHLEDWVSSHG